MLLIINTLSLFIWIYRFIPRNQYNYAIRRIKLLRVRLIETSKIPQNNTDEDAKLSKFYSRDFKLQTSVGLNKKTAISRILSQHDYHYSIDELSMDSSNKPKNLNRRSKMFPNIPSDFEFNASLKYRKKGERIRRDSSGTTINSSFEPTFKQMRVPIKNQYDSYMLPKSFCIKNYEAFVYEYLEADGMFMLRMIHSNSGDFVCTQVLHNLWKLFLYKKFILKNEKKNDNNNNSNSEIIYSSDDENDNINTKKNSRVHYHPTTKQTSNNNKRKSSILNKLFKPKSTTAKFVSKRIEKNRSYNKNDQSPFAADLSRMQSIKRVVNRPNVKLKTIPP
jgi:hypothetical protein